MVKYETKPAKIEAEFIMSYMDMESICKWINDNGGKAVCGQQDDGPAEILISTRLGLRTARVGDHIVRLLTDEMGSGFYVCDTNIFNTVFEKQRYEVRTFSKEEICSE